MKNRSPIFALIFLLWISACLGIGYYVPQWLHIKDDSLSIDIFLFAISVPTLLTYLFVNSSFKLVYSATVILRGVTILIVILGGPLLSILTVYLLHPEYRQLKEPSIRFWNNQQSEIALISSNIICSKDNPTDMICSFPIKKQYSKTLAWVFNGYNTKSVLSDGTEIITTNTDLMNATGEQ